MPSNLIPTGLGGASGPFNIELTDCMGDSVSVINANTNYLASYTAAVSSTASSQINTAVTTLSAYAKGTALLSNNGYQIFPSGLITQWGVTGNVSGDSAVTVNFPIPFPNACLNAQVTVKAAGDTWAQLHSFTTTTIRVGRGFASPGINSSGPIYWLATGY
jgi:type 1 fimbria pilin